MSYVRACTPLMHVNANSKDYIYRTEDKNGKKWIEDYGNISDNGIVEFCCKAIDAYYQEDKVFADYLKDKLSKRLNVVLRKKQLTDKQQIRMLLKNIKRFEKKIKK